jgi:hypothetical protein
MLFVHLLPKAEIPNLSLAFSLGFVDQSVDGVDPVEGLHFNEELVIVYWTFANLILDCQELGSDVAI